MALLLVLLLVLMVDMLAVMLMPDTDVEVLLLVAAETVEVLVDNGEGVELTQAAS